MPCTPMNTATKNIPFTMDTKGLVIQFTARTVVSFSHDICKDQGTTLYFLISSHCCDYWDV